MTGRRAAFLISIALLTAPMAVYAEEAPNETTDETQTFQMIEPSAEEQKVSVIGTAEVSVVPDYARVVYAVTTQAETAKVCQEENDKAVRETIDTLEKLGVEQSSIKTDFRMSPIRDWELTGNPITGYEEYTTISVSDIKVDDLGSLLAESVKSGVNAISSISYYSSEFDSAYNQALKEAMQMARSKAEVLAAAENCIISCVKSVNESGYNDAARYTEDNSLMDLSAKAAGNDMVESVVVSPGTTTVSAEVNVTYLIQ